MTLASYPLDRRLFWSLWIWLRKFVLSVFVRRYLCDSPRAMLFPIPGGWKEEPWTYVCLFVGLVYVLMSSICLVWKSVPLYMVMKLISVAEHSLVNFMVGWSLLQLWTKFSKLVRSPSHIKNMSSM